MNDQTVPLRNSEAIDVDALRRYLGNRLDHFVGEVAVEQFPAGSSNLTYLVLTGSEEYVLRRSPFGNTVTTAHDMSREFEVLSKLSTIYPPAPKPVHFCDDESVIGAEFYLMERRNGLIIRGQISQNHLRERVANSRIIEVETEREKFENSQEFRLRVCRSFIQNLAELHALDYESAGLGNLGKPEGYCRRQVEGWTKRYLAAKTHELPEVENVIKWLNTNIPVESGSSLVHNDYKFDNVMLDPNDLTRITAVLDWEMVTIGDPLMDLGTTLGYWMSREAGEEMLNMPFNPRVLMENISRRELAEMYAEASGRDISNMPYYYVFGTFKIAVIAQQIYARYVKGFTSDARFAGFDKSVVALGRIAMNALGKDSIGNS